MPEEPGNPEANKPNPHEVVQGLLAKLGIPVQQPTPPAGNCADSIAGGVSETGECASARSPVSAVSAFGVRSSDVAGDIAGSQLPTPATPEAQVGGGSFEVNCVPCGGCCGNRRGRRLPSRVYDFVAWVAGVRGVAMCQVVNEYPELFCRGLRRGRRDHGLGRVKELERLLSREVEYKSSYVLGRLNECLNDAVCWRYLRLGVEGWFRVAHLLANREPGDVDGYFGRLVRGLGFGSVVDASRYLRLVVQGLVELNYVNRGRGYRDALSVRCRICGGVIDATGPLPGVLFNIVRHFRVVHGLKAIGDVEGKIREFEGREANRPEEGGVGVRLLRHSGEVTQLVRLVVHRLMDVGLLERIGKEYRCRACNADVGDSIEALAHALNHHYGVVDRLLSKPDDPHSSGCHPEDIGAEPGADQGSVLYRLACELFKRFGKPGDYVTLAEMLLKDIKNGCSEKHLEKLGYGNAKLLLGALKALKLC